MTTIIRAIQIFNSFQGECVDSGKRMLLIRYKRCNRNCPWCDAQSLMRNSAELETTIGEIQQIIDETNNGLLITGGETSFGLNYNYTLHMLNKINAPIINVETNGYQLERLTQEFTNKKKNVKFILSPKLFDKKDLVFYFDLANKLVNDERVYIKLVYENSENNNEFMNYLNEIKFPNERIYLMPEGVTINQLITNSKIVFNAAEKFKVNFSSRDHIIYNFL